MREAFILALALIICSMIYGLLAFLDHRPNASPTPDPAGATPGATTPTH